MTEPLPCPFCFASIDPDSEESWHFNGGGPPPQYQVRCDCCGAQGPYGSGQTRGDYAGAREEAIREWNRRLQVPTTPELSK